MSNVRCKTPPLTPPLREDQKVVSAYIKGRQTECKVKSTTTFDKTTSLIASFGIRLLKFRKLFLAFISKLYKWNINFYFEGFWTEGAARAIESSFSFGRVVTGVNDSQLDFEWFWVIWGDLGWLIGIFVMPASGPHEIRLEISKGHAWKLHDFALNP